MSRSRSNANPEDVLEFAIECARALSDDRTEDVVLLDVRGLSQVSDYVLLGSGSSERQMKSAAQAVEDIGKAQGNPPFKSTKDTGTTWILVDFVETVVHLFEPEHRLYYDLESLWREGRQIDWERPEVSS